MKFPNKYLRNLKPYKLASHKVWSVEPGERNNILKLDWNESTIPPSPKVAEYLNKILCEPSFFNLYPTTYNKKFCTIVREMNKQKLTWLLRQFGLENRIVRDLKHLENILETEIDYRSVNEKIVFETLRSKAYLRESLTLQK